MAETIAKTRGTRTRRGRRGIGWPTVADVARIATRRLTEGLRRNQTRGQHQQLAFELVHRGSVAPPSGEQVAAA